MMLGTGLTQCDAIGGNIVVHGCHFRLQFQAKWFQWNKSLERKATIVDAPDLQTEDSAFFITEGDVADSEQVGYAIPGVNAAEPVKKRKKVKVTSTAEEEALEEV